MKLPGEKLKELQKHWYKVLADSGFKDIETVIGGQHVLKQMVDHNFWALSFFDFEMNAEYFRRVYEKAHDEETFYKDEVDKMILQLYSDGSRVTEIINHLKSMGISRHRHSIRFIIRRYLVDWKIRNFTPAQLNKKVS